MAAADVATQRREEQVGFALMAIGLGCALYGVALKRRNLRSTFFPVWLAGAAVFALLGVIERAGAAGVVPATLGTGVGVAGTVLAFVLLAGGGRIMAAARSTAPDGLDWIIVLGAHVRPDGEPSRALRHRLEAALAYLEANPMTGVVASGGRGSNEPCTEAAAMARWLTARGIARERIVEEGASTTTAENIAYARRLIARADRGAPREGARIGIVTNDFHLYRALRIARHQGLARVWGIAAMSTPFYLPQNLLRELLALIKNRLRGTL